MNAEICADVVISGGGSCRAVLAARLSEDPALQLCLLDAGAGDSWLADRGLFGHDHGPEP
jgi:choline dehydrogenase-like flavoprotein